MVKLPLAEGFSPATPNVVMPLIDAFVLPPRLKAIIVPGAIPEDGSSNQGVMDQAGASRCVTVNSSSRRTLSAEVALATTSAADVLVAVKSTEIRW